MIVKAGILAKEKITMRFGGRNLALRWCYEYLVCNDNSGCTVGVFFCYCYKSAIGRKANSADSACSTTIETKKDLLI